MRGIHARVQHGDDRTAAVEPATPREIGADERHALGEDGPLDRVIEDAVHPQRRAFEAGERVGVDLERDERHVVVSVHDAIVGLAQPRHQLAADLLDVGALQGRGRVGQAAFGNVTAARQPQRNEDTRAVAAGDALANFR